MPDADAFLLSIENRAAGRADVRFPRSRDSRERAWIDGASVIASEPFDVSRVARIATLLFAVAAAALVYAIDEPRVRALQFRIDDAATALRSEEIAAHEAPALRDERDALAARYASLFAQNSEALFLRELLTLTRSRRVRVIATSLAAAEPERTSGGSDLPFLRTRGTLELRGAYRDFCSSSRHSRPVRKSLLWRRPLYGATARASLRRFP